MKPISQIFELVVEHIPGFPYPGDMSHYMNLENHWYNKYDGDLKKTIKKISQIKQSMVHKLIFEDLMVYANNKVNKINTIDKYFKKKNKSNNINKNYKLNNIIKKNKKSKNKLQTSSKNNINIIKNTNNINCNNNLNNNYNSENEIIKKNNKKGESNLLKITQSNKSKNVYIKKQKQTKLDTFLITKK